LSAVDTSLFDIARALHAFVIDTFVSCSPATSLKGGSSELLNEREEVKTPGVGTAQGAFECYMHALITMGIFVENETINMSIAHHLNRIP
jgi:hypothetical protein